MMKEDRTTARVPNMPRALEKLQPCAFWPID